MLNYPTTNLFSDILKELGSSYTHVNYKDDIIELDDKFLVELELPGFQKSNIEMSVEKDALTVSAKKDSSEIEGTYIRKSRSNEEFKKIYHLGDGIDVEKIEATLADGLLTITLPKGGKENIKKIDIA